MRGPNEPNDKTGEKKRVNPIEIMLLGFVILAGVMAALWVVQLRTKNAGIVDVAWAFGVGGLGVLYAVLGSGAVGYRILIAAMTGIWGLRLGAHLFARVVGAPEEGRYRRLRDRWGESANRNLLVFFELQAVLAVVLSVPFVIAASADALPGPLWIASGLALFAMAIVGETVADRQLARFVARPDSRGRTCREGFWRYSRHPNYFFEWLVWVSFAWVVTPAPWGILAWVSPVLMLFLVLRVTGIPPTEQQALASRGEDYRRYQRETSAFVPWWPKPHSVRGGE